MQGPQLLPHVASQAARHHHRLNIGAKGARVDTMTASSPDGCLPHPALGASDPQCLGGVLMNGGTIGLDVEHYGCELTHAVDVGHLLGRQEKGCCRLDRGCARQGLLRRLLLLLLLPLLLLLR